MLLSTWPNSTPPDAETSEWVSEQILNLTSAQLGYTVAFTTVYAGKYGEKTNQKQTLLKLPRKSKQHKTQQKKLHWFSRLLRHSARKQGGLILHTGHFSEQLASILSTSFHFNYTVFRKKHPLTFSFISPIVISGFKQKLQWIYLRKGRFWQCRN